ncbi:DUF397 domain-containing protein [Streptomyces sp. NPDC048057]|uniref:DUF397 domain-containing protein n=1 Tax=Streptomyces sp. NPDC048057 TaxID=3155628 RepID=UPI0033EDF83C
MTNGQAPQLHWSKSSHSGSEGGECVEVATSADAIHVRDTKNRRGAQLTFTPAAWTGFITGQAAQLNWRKSSHSGSEGGACVEVAANPDAIHVRDSKNRRGAQLAFTPTAWTGFIAGQRTQPDGFTGPARD